MNPALSVLRQCRLFQDLPPEVLAEEILPRGRLRDFDKQSVLIAPGDRVDWFAVEIGRAHV